MSKLDEIEASMSEQGGVYDLDPADVKLLVRAVRQFGDMVMDEWGEGESADYYGVDPGVLELIKEEK